VKKCSVFAPPRLWGGLLPGFSVVSRTVMLGKEIFWRMALPCKKAVLQSLAHLGGVPEWLKGADCKSVGLRLRWFESSLLHQGEPILGPGIR
jgi:hypothetical protein